MREINSLETLAVSAADGRFRVIITTNPSPACAAYFIKLFERYLTGEINSKKISDAIYDSEFSNQDAELAFQGIDIVYWKEEEVT